MPNTLNMQQPVPYEVFMKAINIDDMNQKEANKKEDQKKKRLNEEEYQDFSIVLMNDSIRAQEQMQLNASKQYEAQALEEQEARVKRLNDALDATFKAQKAMEIANRPYGVETTFNSASVQLLAMAPLAETAKYYATFVAERARLVELRDTVLDPQEVSATNNLLVGLQKAGLSINQISGTQLAVSRAMQAIFNPPADLETEEDKEIHRLRQIAKRTNPNKETDVKENDINDDWEMVESESDKEEKEFNRRMALISRAISGRSASLLSVDTWKKLDTTSNTVVAIAQYDILISKLEIESKKSGLVLGTDAAAPVNNAQKR